MLGQVFETFDAIRQLARCNEGRSLDLFAAFMSAAVAAAAGIGPGVGDTHRNRSARLAAQDLPRADCGAAVTPNRASGTELSSTATGDAQTFNGIDHDRRRDDWGHDLGCTCSGIR